MSDCEVLRYLSDDLETVTFDWNQDGCYVTDGLDLGIPGLSANKLHQPGFHGEEVASIDYLNAVVTIPWVIDGGHTWAEIVTLYNAACEQVKLLTNTLEFRPIADPDSQYIMKTYRGSPPTLIRSSLPRPDAEEELFVPLTFQFERDWEMSGDGTQI
jgi:hypothetical protein